MRAERDDRRRDHLRMSALRFRPLGRAPLGALVLLSLVGCSTLIDERRCIELLDHYTDRLIDQARPGASNGERAKLKSLAREKARLDPEFRACPQRVTEAAFECASRAATSDEIERCLL